MERANNAMGTKHVADQNDEIVTTLTDAELSEIGGGGGDVIVGDGH